MAGRLSQAGFTVQESARGLATYGRLCRVHSGNDGGELSEYEDFSVDNMVFILDHLATALQRADSLEAPKGVKCTTEPERRALLQEIKERLCADGALSVGRYWIARK